MNNLRTIEAQIVSNLRTTSPGKNLLVLQKKACISDSQNCPEMKKENQTIVA